MHAAPKRMRASGREQELLVDISRSVVCLDNVQREATSMLHAGSAKDCAKRARGAALLPNDLADIGRSNFEPKYGGVLIEDHFHLDGGGVIHQSLGDLNNECADLGDRV